MEHLHRLPCEVHAPLGKLLRSMIAWSVANKQRGDEMERRIGHRH